MDDDRLLGILGSNGAGKTTPIHVLVCADFPYPVPLPLTAADRDGGSWWPLSMRQVETCRTLVFDAPRRACARSLSPGWSTTSTSVARIGSRSSSPGDRPDVATRDTCGVTINADYKHSRIKQHLKDGRALRIETVLKPPTCRAGLCPCEPSL
ncbi:MAG: hypothetical protein V9G19_13045 [Tetrasphaera sp.]